MRITGYQIDWKDDFDSDVIERMIADIDSERTFTAEFDVSEWVDAKLLIVSDEFLNKAKLAEIWDNGDLGVADKIYEGSFNEILEQLRYNAAGED